MEIEIIIKNATLKEVRELFTIIPEKAIVHRAGNHQNLVATVWSDEEKDAIRNCSTREDAVKAYRAAFPHSSRTKHAVYRKYQYVREEDQDKKPLPILVVASPEGKPKVDMRHIPRKTKWQIPFDSKTEKEKYHTAFYLCKKYNLPYPEVPYPEAVIKQAAEKHHNIDVDKIPDPVEVSAKLPVTMDKIPVSQLVAGMMVKQIKPDRGLLVKGTCTVTARRGGIIECTHEGKKHLIDAECLEVI
jgi:hypothetical protein